MNLVIHRLQSDNSLPFMLLLFRVCTGLKINTALKILNTVNGDLN